MAETAIIHEDVMDFLMGIGDLEGVSFGDRHPTRKGAFWWRTVVRERQEVLESEFICTRCGIRHSSPVYGVAPF